MLATVLLLAAIARTDIIEVETNSSQRPFCAVMLSGDGGWAAIDRSLTTTLAKRGVPTAGINSLRYFWRERTPDELASDLANVIATYRAKWGSQRVILIGYSRGADVLPFAVARLPRDLRDSVALVALLGPSREATFEFHTMDWLGVSRRGTPVLPEAKKLRGMRVLCVHGDDEDDSLCKDLDASLATDVVLHGGHHFGGDYASIGERIVAEARR